MFEFFSDSSDLWQILSVFLNLGIVLLLIFALATIIRRFKIPGSVNSSKQLSLLETLYLSPKQKVHLVRAGDKVFMVGATDATLSLLSEVDVEITLEPISVCLPPAQKVLAERLTALHLDRFIPRWNGAPAPVQPEQGK